MRRTVIVVLGLIAALAGGGGTYLYVTNDTPAAVSATGDSTGTVAQPPPAAPPSAPEVPNGNPVAELRSIGFQIVGEGAYTSEGDTYRTWQTWADFTSTGLPKFEVVTANGGPAEVKTVSHKDGLIWCAAPDNYKYRPSQVMLMFKVVGPKVRRLAVNIGEEGHRLQVTARGVPVADIYCWRKTAA